MELPVYHCVRCEHEWIPRVPDPVRCPACLAFDWREKPPPEQEEETKPVRAEA